jgi:sugar phosphate isomerase/epimerase
LIFTESGGFIMERRNTRRTFLGTAAGIAGLNAVGVRPAAAVIEPEPWGIKLGVATYSLRSFDRAKAIEMLKALEIQFVSIKDVHLSQTVPMAEVEAGAKEFTSAGLKIMSGGNVDMKETTVEGLRKHFEYAKHAGMPMMVCAPLQENVKLVEQLVKEYNIKCAIHNHGPEDKHFPTPQSVLKAVQGMDHRMGLCMDIGHSARAGADVVKSISEAGERLLDMHVKDLSSFTVPAGKKPGDVQVDVGAGIMPFPQIFKQLKKMKYTGCVNLEYEINAKDPLPGMQRSFFYLRGVLAGLAAA